MLRTSLLGVALLALTMPAESIRAQETTPTHVVMRYFKCSPQGVGVAQLQEWRTIVDGMIDEGHFIDNGILSHNWGDEWNVVDYFVDGIAAFFDSFGEMATRIGAAAEAEAEGSDEADDDTPSFGEACTEHKDNIYSYVAPPM